MNWQDKAACRNYNPEWWFGDRPSTRHVAKQICLTECPVTVECLVDEINYTVSRMLQPRGRWQSQLPELVGIRAGLEPSVRARAIKAKVEGND